MDSRILRRHILCSRSITLTLSILMGCSWSPTAVRGDFCLRWSIFHPCLQGAGSISDILCKAFQTLDFIDDTPLFVTRCLAFWGGPGWSAGCWRACGKPRLRGFWKFWPVFLLYLWYSESPRRSGPGPLWCWEVSDKVQQNGKRGCGGVCDGCGVWGLGVGGGGWGWGLGAGVGGGVWVVVVVGGLGWWWVGVGLGVGGWVRVRVRVRVRVKKLYLTSDSVKSTTLSLTWNEC